MTATYRPLTGLVVRAPLLPAADFAGLGADGPGQDVAWADSTTRYAVAVASPDLAAALSVAPSRRQSPARARAALQRYLIRACLRPTPFGLFAGVAIARWATATDLRIAPGGPLTRTRPDMGWLTAVARAIVADPACGTALRVVANTCALNRDGRIYLADPSTALQSGPDVSVRATPVVRRILCRARAGASLAELHRYALETTPGATAAKVDGLLAQLSEHGLLVPELLPSLTGEPLRHVLDGLDGIPAAADRAAELREIGAACADLDAAEHTAALDALPRLRVRMRALADTGAVAEDLQIDAALPLLADGVTRQVADDVAAAVETLLRLHPKGDPIAPYRAQFHARYGDDRPVPLLELLDPRFGLGAHADAGYRAAGGHNPIGRGAVLQELVACSIRDGCTEVVLDPPLQERLGGSDPDPGSLPPSLELSVFVAARNRAALDRGEYRLVVGPNLGASAAGRSLGRFADLLGAPAHHLLREAAAAESAEAATDIVAELVYRPVRPRAGNVAVRPLVHNHEIPVGVASGLPPERVIPVDELAVVLRAGRLRLWWNRAGREVRVAGGHMLNPAAAPPLCRAILDIAADGRTELAPFDWGPMSAMPFLPRVRTDRVVLRPAQWRLAPLGDVRPDEELARWRRRWCVPRYVYLTEADNRLLLDLDDPSHRRQLLAATSRPGGRAATLQEGLPGPDDAWLPGPQGRHIVELIVPLLRSVRPARATDSTSIGPSRAPLSCWPDTDRRRPPGSDWLYVTAYGALGAEDELLVGSLGELLEDIIVQGDADGWFFVRYGDPERHLRLRLHGDPDALTVRVLPRLASWGATAIATGGRTRFTVETYERELERYGGPITTELCERIACADSQAVRRMLAARKLGARQELAVASLADLLTCFAVDLAFERPNRASDAEAARMFRERKERYRTLIAAPPAILADIFADRRAVISPIIAAVRDRHRDGTGKHSIRQLAPSLLHMHANRIGLSRTTESVALGILARALRSVDAYPPIVAEGRST
jgi:thiopeptide-type bacteriocin biosynthesis protein